jgi:hypothetical protein
MWTRRVSCLCQVYLTLTSLLNSSSDPKLAATLLSKLLGFSTVSSRSACFSAVVLTVIGFAGHRSSNAALNALKDAVSVVVSVNNHASAGDLVFTESSKNLTLSVLDNPDFMRIVRSILFMKSCGSWSSSFPVKNVSVVSVISSSSKLITGFTDIDLWGTGGIIMRLLSCGVQIAGDNVNWESCVDSSERLSEVLRDSSESPTGEVLLVSGR